MAPATRPDDGRLGPHPNLPGQPKRGRPRQTDITIDRTSEVSVGINGHDTNQSLPSGGTSSIIGTKRPRDKNEEQTEQLQSWLQTSFMVDWLLIVVCVQDARDQSRRSPPGALFRMGSPLDRGCETTLLQLPETTKFQLLSTRTSGVLWRTSRTSGASSGS